MQRKKTNCGLENGKRNNDLYKEENGLDNEKAKVCVRKKHHS